MSSLHNPNELLLLSPLQAICNCILFGSKDLCALWVISVPLLLSEFLSSFTSTKVKQFNRTYKIRTPVTSTILTTAASAIVSTSVSSIVSRSIYQQQITFSSYSAYITLFIGITSKPIIHSRRSIANTTQYFCYIREGHKFRSFSSITSEEIIIVFEWITAQNLSIFVPFLVVTEYGIENLRVRKTVNKLEKRLNILLSLYRRSLLNCKPIQSISSVDVRTSIDEAILINILPIAKLYIERKLTENLNECLRLNTLTVQVCVYNNGIIKEFYHRKLANILASVSSLKRIQLKIQRIIY